MGQRPDRRIATVAELREMFTYDTITGDLLWQSPKGRVRAGTPCRSSRGNGYYQVEVFGKNQLVHRIVYAIVTGEWPTHVLDHIDGNPRNNVFKNLRDIRQSVNLQNVKQARASNQLGILGVIAHRGRFRASVTLNGKCVHCSYHETAAEAHEAYLVAKRKLHEGNTL